MERVSGVREGGAETNTNEDGRPCFPADKTFSPHDRIRAGYRFFNACADYYLHLYLVVILIQTVLTVCILRNSSHTLINKTNHQNNSIVVNNFTTTVQQHGCGQKKKDDKPTST